MNPWLEEMAAVYEGGRADRCEYGHGAHQCRTVDVHLGARPLPDCPAPPVALVFPFQVFQAGAYQEAGYCSGDDELSRSVLAQGTWEPWETALALAILHDPSPGVVLDIGSHIGWYSILAALAGRDVLAVDAEEEHLDVLRETTELNEVAGRVTTARGWVGSDHVKRAPAGGADDRVRLVKIDVEGQEGSAAVTLAGLLDAGVVDYALVELSPEFGSGWETAISVFELFGYTGYLVPTKGADLDRFEADPLGCVLAAGPIPGDLAVQRTALFARP